MDIKYAYKQIQKEIQKDKLNMKSRGGKNWRYSLNECI
jgi:hypothetical protein